MFLIFGEELSSKVGVVGHKVTATGSRVKDVDFLFRSFSTHKRRNACLMCFHPFAIFRSQRFIKLAFEVVCTYVLNLGQSIINLISRDEKLLQSKTPPTCPAHLSLITYKFT